MSPEPSVVLITSADPKSIGYSGSGFIVGRQGSLAYVATCDHVVTELGELTKIQVAGRPARLVGERLEGVDLAVLAVDGLPGPVLKVADDGKPGRPYWLLGFRSFANNVYLHERVAVKLTGRVAFQERDAGRSFPGWHLRVNSKLQQLYKGFSGGPVFSGKDKAVVAVGTHLQGDGRAGWGLCGAAVSEYVARVLGAAGATKTAEAPPPEPGPVLQTDDPQKGRWGGQVEQNGRRLEGVLADVSKRFFRYHLVVRSTDNSTLVGPVRFHLHDSYALSVIWIRKIRPDNTAVLAEIDSEGVYTAAAQVKDAAGNWVALEFDISNIPGLPRRFLVS